MDRYRVPKQRVSARISLRGGTEEHVQLFLGDRAETHNGPERPSDLLNRREAFVAVEFDGGAVHVLSRHAFAFLVVDASLEADREVDSKADPADETRSELQVTLDDGREIAGVARYRLPESARRLQDFLNQEPAFLRLEHGEDVLLVNKRSIVRVREDGCPDRTAA